MFSRESLIKSKMFMKPEKESVDSKKESETPKSQGVIQRVKLQYFHGHWIPISGVGPARVPRHIPREDYGVYDTVTGLYTGPEESPEESATHAERANLHARAGHAKHAILHARARQKERAIASLKQGAKYKAHNKSDRFFSAKLGKKQIMETPFKKGSLWRGWGNQPYVHTSGAPHSYTDLVNILDQMDSETKGSVIDTMLDFMKSDTVVQAPPELMSQLTEKQQNAITQITLLLTYAETHNSRALRDGGKWIRAALRRAKDTSFKEMFDSKTGLLPIAQVGGNKQTRELFEKEEVDEDVLEFATVDPYLSDSSEFEDEEEEDFSDKK